MSLDGLKFFFPDGRKSENGSAVVQSRSPIVFYIFCSECRSHGFQRWQGVSLRLMIFKQNKQFFPDASSLYILRINGRRRALFCLLTVVFPETNTINRQDVTKVGCGDFSLLPHWSKKQRMLTSILSGSMEIGPSCHTVII